MSHFTELYHDFFATIGRPLTEADAIDPAALAGRDIAVPAAIADFYAVAGRAIDFTQSYERFLGPDKWITSKTVTAVVEEYQGVSLWGYRHQDQHREDPEVYYTLQEEELDWEPFDIKWSEFILLTLCLQNHNAHESPMPFMDTALLTDKVAEKIAGTWRKVGQWHDRFAYIRPNCILCHLNYDGEQRIFLAAQSEEIIQDVAEELGLELEETWY